MRHPAFATKSHFGLALIGLLPLTAIILFIAKILGVIKLGWIWVIAPWWVSSSFLFLAVVTLLIKERLKRK